MGDENWLGRDPLGRDQSGTLQEESTWPAERTPGRLDAERAHRPLDSSFVHSFKLTLANDQAAGATINYLNDANEGSIYVSNPGSPRLPYPLMLFSHFPSVPSEETLRLLVNEFSEKVHPRITILRSIPIETLTHDKVPKYLTLAMACLGCFAAEGMSSTAENMWWAANFLITATLEVDNREARKADLISAWAMLETYGALSADLSIWHRTNITHGYVETAARRLLSPSFNKSEPSRPVDRVGRTDDKYSCSAVSYFVLIDVLRSVHYGLPSTLSVFELLTSTTFLNGELNSIYSCIVLDSRLPLSDVSIDSTVLALVSILTDIHTLSTVFHALEAENSHPDKTDPTRADRAFSIFHNPYLPFSPANENRRVNQKLHKALDLWGERYLGRASKDIVALFYFSKMYLNLPSLRLLPIMAGYTPGLFKDQAANSYVMRVVDSELCDGSEALKNAWIILENIETSEDVTPVWFPVILFYASLVVWRMISLQPGPGSYGSIRVLHLFKSELEKMKWPCCGTMVKVLESLLE